MIITDASADACLRNEAARELISRLSDNSKKLLENKHKLAGSKEFEAAMATFRQHCPCKVDAPEIKLVFNRILEDPTVYETMKGFFEISITETLKK